MKLELIAAFAVAGFVLALLLLVRQRKKFSELAGNPKLAYQTAGTPCGEIENEKRDALCVRNFFAGGHF